jgi:hypothetical protein
LFEKLGLLQNNPTPKGIGFSEDCTVYLYYFETLSVIIYGGSSNSAITYSILYDACLWYNIFLWWGYEDGLGPCYLGENCGLTSLSVKGNSVKWFFSLKVPKCDIFMTELFTLSVPIWKGDLRTEPQIHLCKVLG